MIIYPHLIIHSHSAAREYSGVLTVDQNSTRLTDLLFLQEKQQCELLWRMVIEKHTFEMHTRPLLLLSLTGQIPVCCVRCGTTVDYHVALQQRLLICKTEEEADSLEEKGIEVTNNLEVVVYDKIDCGALAEEELLLDMIDGKCHPHCLVIEN